MAHSYPPDAGYETALAIVGMSGRFPGAQDVEQFWQHIVQGIKSIRTFSDEELLAAGVDRELLNDSNYVKAGSVLSDLDRFDASFFGYTPYEAKLMDPQHRLFLECSWEALEQAGYATDTFQGLVGVFGGSGFCSYLLHNIYQHPDFAVSSASLPTLPMAVGNERDSLVSTVSYKLNLKGPSIAVQTFCSTSLVAVHIACQSLLNYECDIALAGGAAITVPQGGYLYEPGGILSPDGECRTFDASAQGSVMGNGVGVVSLKRLSDALQDGDSIYAVIRGSAVNNDGSIRVSYTAPALDGQAAVISEGLGNAGVDADTIQYIEAHGTATVMGDAIELAALLKAFGLQTQKQQYCALGSVKPNIGHLDRASGVTGLIKTALALQHKQLPPSLNFTQTDTDIDLASSPFFVNTEVREWKRGTSPRRAGVNSFGLGGTNAHMVLEEAPELPPSGPSRPHQLLLLSAKTPSALHQASLNLHEHLQHHPELSLPDVAYTLQVGRKAFPYRRALLASSLPQALASLTAEDPARPPVEGERPVTFLFSGVGELAPGMAHDLYLHEPTFRQVVDQCAQLLLPLLDVDLRTRLWPSSSTAPTQPGIDLRAMLGQRGAPTSLLARTRYAQPAVFVLDYALAQLLLSWGIHPQSLLGYSLGEYVAACLAGVFSLSDALTLVARRAALIDQLPSGAMLAVSLSDRQVQPYLGPELTLAITTGPAMCVVAGPEAAIAALEQRCEAQEIVVRRLQTTHAFHSPLLAPARQPLAEVLVGISLSAPQIPYLSNLTGTWITAEQATSRQYWLEQMCEPVRFSEALSVLAHSEPVPVLVEVGPGQALTSIAKMHPACRSREVLVVPTTRPHYQQQDDQALLLQTLGQLWQAGVPVDWTAFSQQEERRRVLLPTYPFERQRYWIDPPRQQQKTASIPEQVVELTRQPDISDWFFVPSWKRGEINLPFVTPAPQDPKRMWLVFRDQCGLGADLADFLQGHGEDVVSVEAGTDFLRLNAHAYRIHPTRPADYETLLRSLRKEGKIPTDVVHLWMVTSSNNQAVETIQELGFYSLLALVQSLGTRDQSPCTLTIVSNELQEIMDGEPLCPAKATVLGPARVAPLEYTHLRCRSLDILLPAEKNTEHEALIEQLAGELTHPPTEGTIALRGKRRWIQTLEPVRLPASPQLPPVLRHEGVYLITGGLGGTGLTIAEHLVRTVQARLVLTSRSGLPPREQWAALLEKQGDTRGVGRQIRAVQHLEALGAHVLVLAADASNEQQMRGVFQQAIDTFGTIHGILHTAGMPGVGLIQFKTPEAAARVLQPKVMGTLVLDRLIQEYALSLDYLVLFSSITSLIGGGPGQVDYCAANAFLDAYAQSRRNSPGLTVTINWGSWLWNAWDSELDGYGASGQSFFREHRERCGFTFAEGIEALMRILAHNLPEVAVSTQNLVILAELCAALTTTTVLQYGQTQQDVPQKHARPELSSSYVAPRNELERKIASVWEDLLGLAPVGIYDNFFDLGGNSLTGLALMARLRRVLDNDQITAPLLYEAPSVSTLVQLLHTLQRSDQHQDQQQQEWDERSEKRRGGFRQRVRETSGLD